MQNYISETQSILQHAEEEKEYLLAMASKSQCEYDLVKKALMNILKRVKKCKTALIIKNYLN